MAVYVDDLGDRGWVMNGRPIKSCHLFTDTLDLAELHRIAASIGLRREWFQNKAAAPHYDLTPKKRQMAIAAGAQIVQQRKAVLIWRARREEVASAEEDVRQTILRTRGPSPKLLRRVGVRP